MASRNRERFWVIQVRPVHMVVSSGSNSKLELKLQKQALSGNWQGFFVSKLHQIAPIWCKNVMSWCIFYISVWT
jgi:hypothetical protein